MTVIVPVGDATHLDTQLTALANQDYSGRWELILANNNPAQDLVVLPDSVPCAAIVQTVDATRTRGASYARNAAAKSASGELLAFCDADDAVQPQWLTALVEAAAQCDLVAGRLDPVGLNRDAVARWRPQRPDGPPSGGFLPFAPSGNMAIWKEVFDSIGGFSDAYPKSQDVELSWRAQLEGHSLGYATEAIVSYRYRSSLSGAFRQAVKAGQARVQLHRDFRDHGHPSRTPRAAAQDLSWLLTRTPFLLAGGHRRGIWVRKLGEACGRLIGSASYRTLYL